MGIKRRWAVAVGGIAVASLTFAGMAAPAGAQGIGVSQAKPVAALPGTATPNITNGVVYSITQVGNSIIAGGTFTTVQNRNSTTTLTRNRVLAFDASTGTVSTTFAPNLDGNVNAVAPGVTAGTVYVGGSFNNVNGVKSKSIALLNVSTGATVSTFKPPALNAAVFAMSVVGNRLLLAGTFTTANGIAHGGLLSLNATTGALDSFMSIQLAGHHNYNGTSGANGGVGARKIAVNPQGTRAMVIGNFKTANGLPRDQAVMIDLDGASATIDPNWSTLQFTAACFSNAFDTYVTDVQYSPDGTYFVIVATGGSGTNSDGSKSLCDTASRWESNATGTNVQPTWVDYTGQDSLWATAISGSAVYVSGHQRWLNNYNGFDYAGAGAVPRPGIAALDPISGVPLTWNPGRNPRGAGAYALFLNSNGLYVGSDTDYIGNFQYKRQRIAYFPLASGVAAASTATAQLPSNMYLAGPLNAGNNVLYRVDAGGPTIPSIDGGPDWMADGSDSDPGAQYRNTGSSSASYSCCVTLAGSVPSSTPNGIFNSERWDSGSKGDGNELHWSFPVPSGEHVAVRMYFANRYSGTSQAGQRVFDVAVDGSVVLPNYDIVADTGDQTGTMKQFNVTSPGAVTIDLTHEVENPLINGIELINLDAPSNSAASPDDLDYRAMSGSKIGGLTTVPNTGVSWSTTRGAFMVGNYIYYGATDGNFYRATFNGTTVGTPSVVDPYNDPAWMNVSTGSGQTYRGTKPNYYSEIPSITGAFYSNGKLYYSVSGQSALYSRWFSPDSGTIGAKENTASAGLNFANVAGMTLSGSTLYYANRIDGSLHSVGFANGVVSGPDTVVSSPATDGRDWRARGLFLYGPATFPNQPPTANAQVSCTNLTCSFDGTQSTDDNSVQSWAWDFGDGSTGTGATTTHSYATPGNYSVSLTVTDNQGAASSPWSGTASPTAMPANSQIAYVGGDSVNSRSSSGPSVTIPTTTLAGDQEFLLVTANAVGVVGTPTTQPGWQRVGLRTATGLETAVYQRTAGAADGNTGVTVPMSSAAGVDVELLVYRHASAAAPTVVTSTDSSVMNHTTPTANTTAGGSWVLSYWADRSSSTSVWTLPNSVTPRQSNVNTGGGHVDAAGADTGQPVASGTYGGLSASTGAVSGKANMVTLVLAPAS